MFSTCTANALTLSENAVEKDLIRTCIKWPTLEGGCKYMEIMDSVAFFESGFNTQAKGPTADVGLFQMTRIGLAEAKKNKACRYLKWEDMLTWWKNSRAALCLVTQIDKRLNGIYNPVRMLKEYNCGIKPLYRCPNSTHRYITKILNREYGEAESNINTTFTFFEGETK
jgi:hypothetical protein